MPRKTITAPGDTKAENIANVGGSGATWDYVHGDTSPSSILADNNRMTTVRHISASNRYSITRALILYDFRGSPIERDIKIARAELILNDLVVAAGTTNGDKLTVGHVFNPNTFGSLHKDDYSLARYSVGGGRGDSRTSAQQFTNGADGAILTIDNQILLKEIEKAINRKTYLHLVVRNELDSSDTAPGSGELSRIWFDRPNADDNPMRLRLFYRIINNRKNPGARPGGVARGFRGSSLFAGTNSGFS